jgi:DNA-binding NarL/FixJ family response regulator
MKSLLVASKNRMAYEPIKECFRSEYKVDVVTTKESCWNLFRKRHYEFLFIDVALLQPGSASVNGRINYKDSLQPFWHVFPNAEIVVMSSQEKIREAVMAVKAGTSNYISC